MATYVIGGDIGGGKTLRAMQWLKDAVDSGRPCYTNIELVPYDPETGQGCPFADKVALIGTRDFPVAVDEDIREKERLSQYGFKYFWEYCERGGFIVIDEGDIYFDSAAFKEMKRQTRIYHKQLRKFKHDVVYIVQRIPSLYNRIRALATTFVYAENTYRTFKPFRWLDKMIGPERAIKLSRFLYFEFEDETLNMRGCRGVGHMTYQEAQQYFGWYRTDQLLGDTLTLLRPTYDTIMEGVTDDEMKERDEGLKRAMDKVRPDEVDYLKRAIDGGNVEGARSVLGEWVNLESRS